VIIEEHMEGPELSLDAVVFRGEATVCGVADRDIRFPPHFVEMGHTMPTALPARVVRAVEDVFCAGIRAIGIDNGAAKGDIKVTRDGVMVGEIAARLSGGYMSGWTFPYASGVEVTAAALDIAVGTSPGDLHPRTRHVSAERAFISLPGRVCAVEGVDRARSVHGVRDVFLRAASGSIVVFPTNNVEKCGNVISAAASRRAAVKAAMRAAAGIRIVLSPNDPGTNAFLFETNAGADSRSAFTVSAAAARALTAMPAFFGDPGAFNPNAPLCVAAFSAGAGGRDWHGLSLRETIRLAEKECCVRFVKPAAAPFCLWGLFWRAVTRGGIQGARYAADSVRDAASRGALRDFLKEICGG
jgi:hypothetical protein